MGDGANQNLSHRALAAAQARLHESGLVCVVKEPLVYLAPHLHHAGVDFGAGQGQVVAVEQELLKVPGGPQINGLDDLQAKGGDLLH